MIAKSKYRFYLWSASVLGVLIFIFANSLLSSEASGEESTSLLAFLIGYFPFLTHHLVRKLAHFCEYALLGVIMAFAPVFLPSRKGVSRIAALCFGVPVSLVDEGIQRFVPGRGPSLTDALIDCAGYLCGLLLVFLILYLISRKGEKTWKKRS